MYYYFADPHWGHANVLKFDRRPFTSIEEHDGTMIFNWNQIVQPDDVVYVIGDLFYRCRKEKMKAIMAELKGIKRLIPGNHDKDVFKMMARYPEFGWELYPQYFEQRFEQEVSKTIEEGGVPLEILKGGQFRIVMCHYPLGSWNRMHRGSWHLHGHCHGNYMFTRGRQLDVGANTEIINYSPISLLQLNEYMKTRTFEPSDSHALTEED